MTIRSKRLTSNKTKDKYSCRNYQNFDWIVIVDSIDKSDQQLTDNQLKQLI